MRKHRLRLPFTVNRLPKRTFYSLLVTCYSLLSLAGCAQREIANIDSRGTQIICFGDSVTLGYAVEPGADFPTLLSKILNRPVINAGVDGDTSTEAMERLEEDVLRKNPLLVIVEFGGNDFLENIPLGVITNNLASIIRKIQQQGAMVAIADVSAGLLLSEHRNALARLAREHQAIFIPQLLSGIITNSCLKSDFLHPNAAGNAIIAQRIYRAIIPYLNKNQLLKTGS